MKLSVCLILKNEGKTIYRCLDSVKSFVDEFIIGIDMSTNDNTREEVDRFLADNRPLKKEFKVYGYKWNDSFSEARNEGMDKATGDYILIMDGHEHIPESWYNITEKKVITCQAIMPKVLETIEKEGSHESFLSLYQQPFVGQMPNNYFLQPRIYKNDVGKDGKTKIRYGRAAHNVIRNTDPEKSIHFPEVIIIHDAPADNRSERAEQRAKMNIEQLENDLKKNKNDTRAYFYLGNTYMEVRDWDNAIKAFNKYIKASKFNTEEKYQVYFHLGLCYKHMDKLKDALDALYHAVRVSPKRRDAYIVIGDIQFDGKRYEEALFNFNTALLIEPKLTRMFSNGAAHTWMPYQRAAYCYAEIGDIQKAVAYLRRAERFVQCPEWDDKIAEWTGKRQNVLIIDAMGSFTKGFVEYLKKNYNVVTVKNYDRYLAEWADYIWQEWGDNNLFMNEMPQKTTVRIHGYEAYMNMNGLQQIPWEKFKSVVFVAKHIREMFPMPSLNGQVQIIQNGVDTDKFYIKNPSRDPKNVGYAGFLNVKKNPMRLAAIIKANPELNFHLRVDWQDPFLQKSFEYETKDCKNIIKHARYKELNDFWNQMSYVISTSDIESFSFNIAEAMSCGCHPLIYPWKGAEDIWPSDSFITGDKLNLEPVRSMVEEREYISENYPESRSIEAMEKELIK